MEPLHDASDVNKAQKADIELVKASRHAAKDLHALEQVFHPVAQSIVTAMKWYFRSAIRFGRDGGCGSFGGEPIPQGITVIPLVGDDPLSFRSLDSLGSLAVSALSLAQGNLHRAARGLAPRFELRFAAPANPGHSTTPSSVGLALAELAPLLPRADPPALV